MSDPALPHAYLCVLIAAILCKCFHLLQVMRLSELGSSEPDSGISRNGLSGSIEHLLRLLKGLQPCQCQPQLYMLQAPIITGSAWL